MTTDERLAALEKLGNYVGANDEVESGELMLKVRNENPWFTAGSVSLALEGVRRYLDGRKLESWASRYGNRPAKPKTVAVVGCFARMVPEKRPVTGGGRGKNREISMDEGKLRGPAA